MITGAEGTAYHPVVVRKPCKRSVESVKVSHAVEIGKLTRAREGRGLRGLGLPVDDACITNDVAHAGGTSLGPRGSASAIRPAVGNESLTNGTGFGLVQDDTAHAEPRC